MKRFYQFFMICLYLLGSIGGLGWSLYSGGYVIAVGCVGLAWMAWPKFIEYIKTITE